MPEPTQQLVPGDLLGDYQLLSKAGEGGMGRVWLARQLGANHLVALKTPRVDSHKLWSALLEEARIASRVAHPNVCHIHAANQDERGIVYLVMDWSDGGSLRELLDATPEGSLPPYLAARIASRVGSGLHAVHGVLGDDGSPLGVVHRDVSPQNILLSTAGQVRLTDFGIAKAQGRLHAPTETGHVKGKFSYMSPEQARAEKLDCRSDVFGLGCVLYEMVTGCSPFKGEDPVATMYQLLEQPLTPARSVANCPAPLDGIISRALARSPRERFQSAGALAQALERFLLAEQQVVTDEEIGQLVQRRLAVRIALQQAEIDEATVRIDKGVLGGGESESPPVPTLAPSSGQTAAATPQAQQQRGLQHWRWPALLAGVAVGGYFLLNESLRTLGTASAPASPPTADAESLELDKQATKRERITIAVKTKPEGATWRLDDGAPQRSPSELTVAVDGAEHTLVVDAKGFEQARQPLAFTRDQNIFVQLSPQPSGDESATSPTAGPVVLSKPRRRPRRGSPPPPETSKPRDAIAAPTAALDVALTEARVEPGAMAVPRHSPPPASPNSTKDPPRQLDQANPFL